MYIILILTLIISLFSPSQRSEASNICSGESGRQSILDEKFHTSLKEDAQKNLVNPRNLFTYWTHQKNISDNLWDSFDLCLSEGAHQSEDSCLKKWLRFGSNFNLFVEDFNHFTKCELPNIEKDAQLREKMGSLLENAYLDSKNIFTNLSEMMIRKSFEGALVSDLNRWAISENERLSEKRKAARSEILNEKTAISDSEIEHLVQSQISSFCRRSNVIDAKNRIICQWPSIRAQILKYENGEKPSFVHMKWIPRVLKTTANVNSAGNLPDLYLTYLLSLERYVVSSYFVLINFIEGDRTGRSSDVAGWMAHDIGTRIVLDRFSQLRLECQFITNIRSMGYSEISTQVCERLNGAAKLLLSNSHVKERISKKLSPAYAAKDRYRDINDALKQLTGRPTRHELNTFLMPHLFRSKREQKSMTAVVRQNDHNLRLIAEFIEKNKELNQVPWLSKISKILEVDTTNCQEISRFLVEFGSADQGIPSFIENAHFLQGKCGHSKDINLWTALGFSFQYENTSLNQLASSMPSKEPSLDELSKLSTVALGISLRLLTLENDSPIELEATRTKLSGATDSLLDWLLDMKHENGIDPMESILSDDSGKDPQIRTSDPDLIEVLELLSKREGV